MARYAPRGTDRIRLNGTFVSTTSRNTTRCIRSAARWSLSTRITINNPLWSFNLTISPTFGKPFRKRSVLMMTETIAGSTAYTSRGVSKHSDPCKAFFHRLRAQMQVTVSGFVSGYAKYLIALMKLRFWQFETPGGFRRVCPFQLGETAVFAQESSSHKSHMCVFCDC